MIALDLSNLHNFLISRGLISEEEVISSQYSVQQFDHRSKVFVVKKGSDEGLFIKQIKSTQDPMPYLLQKDATTLWNIEHEAAFSELKPFSVEYHGYDVPHQALITEFSIGYVNFEEYLLQKPDINNDLISRLVKVLRYVHIPFLELPEIPSVYFYPRSRPWVFEILSLDEHNNWVLPHYAAIGQAVYNHVAFGEELSKASAEWKISSFIHGDIKWTNFLITDKLDTPDVKLIDWEMADIGDPLWDVAGLIQCILKDGVLKRLESLADMFRRDSPSVSFGLICYIIECYSELGSAGVLEPNDIRKIFRYAMIRLLQSACELNDFDPQLKEVTKQVINTVMYMAEHLEEISSLLERKIEKK